MARRSTLIRAVALTAVLLLVGASLALTQQMSDDEAAAVLGFGLMVWVGICCVSLVVKIACAWWMWKDADSKGQSGPLWGILGFFFDIIALIIWLIMRPKT